MDKIIQAFIQILIKENELLDKLLGLNEEKKRTIILGKIQELDKILQKEGIIVAQLEKTETARFKIQEQMACQCEMPVQALTARSVIEKCMEHLPLFTDQLKQEIERMETTIRRQREINQENNELIGMSLEYIDNMQAMLLGDTTGTYSEKGTQLSENASRPTFRIIDKKA